MLTVNYLAFAIPAFFIFLWMEYRLTPAHKRRKVFKYASSVSNLSIGIAERLLNLLISASFFDLFNWVYRNYALFNIPDSWWVWVLLLLTTDLVWYWYHRLGHQVNLLWAAHIVHHQSEEFNLTVAARITVLQALVRNLFWCILPFLGFAPHMVIVILLVHGAYSFFTHTQLGRNLKWLEYIFVTPSIHGVHHASDAHYLDKNYGDVFVFWDKLFGTFRQETTPPKYGLTHPVNSYSFLWQHFHYFAELYEACRKTSGLKNKLCILFGSPALMDQEIRPALESKFFPLKPRRPGRIRFKAYLSIQIMVSVLALIFTIAWYAFFGLADKVFLFSFILLTLINCGALLEQRRWIYYLEMIRLTTVIYYSLYKQGTPQYALPMLLLLLLAHYVFNLEKVYRKVVLGM